MMKIECWTSFSSNNSSSYRLIASFKDAETATLAAAELRDLFAKHAEQVDETGDFDLLSNAQQALAEKHGFVWDERLVLRWGDCELSGDEPSVHVSDARVVIYHSYCGGFEEQLFNYFKAVEAKAYEDRSPPAVTALFRLPASEKAAAARAELQAFFSQGSGADVDDWDEQAPWGDWRCPCYGSEEEPLFFSDGEICAFHLPMAPDDIENLKAYFATLGVERYRLLLCDDSLLEKISLLSRATCCPECGESDLKYFDVESFEDLSEDQLGCRCCGGMFELQAVAAAAPVGKATIAPSPDGPSGSPAVVNTTLFRVRRADDMLVFASGGTTSRGGGVVLRSKDGGGLWEEVHSTPRGLRGICVVSPKQVYAIGEYRTIAGSDDGGDSWTAVEAGGSGCLYNMVCTPNGTLLVGSDDGKLLRSRDGREFEELDTLTGVQIFHLCAFDDSLIYIVGGEGMIARTKDGGDSWQRLRVNHEAPLCRVALLDPKQIVIVGDGGAVLTSDNAGGSFKARTSGTSADIEDMLELDGKLYAITGAGELLCSSDQGKSWSISPTGCERHLWSICPASQPGSLLAVGDSGTVVRISL